MAGLCMITQSLITVPTLWSNADNNDRNLIGWSTGVWIPINWKSDT